MALTTPETVRVGVYPRTNLYSTGTPDNRITDGYIDLAVLAEFATPVNHTIFSNWAGAGGNNASNSSFILQITADGKLTFTLIDGAGAFNGPTSTVTLATAPGWGVGVPIWISVKHNRTAATVGGIAPGAAVFATSIDGVTFTQLGATIAGLGTNGFALGQTTYNVGTINDANPMYGQFYKVKMLSATGVSRVDLDITRQTIGQKGTFVDQAASPNTWNINGPLHNDLRVRSKSATVARMYGDATRYKTEEILPSDVAGQPAAAGSWGKMWAQYVPATFDARLNAAKSTGAQAVKIACSGAYDVDYPAQATLQANITDFASRCRAKGLKIYLSIGSAIEVVGVSGTGLVAQVAARVACLNLWKTAADDILVGVDLCNEIQFGAPAASGWPTDGASMNPTMANDLAYYGSQVRAAYPDMPLSVSVYLDGRDMSNHPLLGLQGALQLDYHDFHPYYGLNNTTAVAVGAGVQAADLASLEGARYFLGRHFIGECGILQGNAAAAKTSWINGMAAVANLPLSLGGVLFGDQSFSSASESGLYGISNDATMLAAFNAWLPLTLGAALVAANAAHLQTAGVAAISVSFTLAYIPSPARTHIANGNDGGAYLAKAAGAVLDYPIQYPRDGGETIVSSSWTVLPVETGGLSVVAGSPQIAGALVACLVGGGIAGNVYTLQNDAVSSAGRTYETVLTFRIGPVAA